MSAPPRPRIRVPWTGLAISAATAWALALALAASAGGMRAVAGFVAVAAGLLAAGFAAGAAGQRRRELERLSADLTAVSERLLRIEGRAPASSTDAVADLRSATREVASDLEIIGRAVTSLGETVGEHERRLRGAEDALSAERRTSRDPYRLDPARLESRDDFARATDLIMRHLAVSSPPAEEPREAAPPPPREAAPVAKAVESAAASPARAQVVRSGIEDGLVLDALAAGRVELHLRAVVTLPQRRTRLYDALPRLRDADGSLLPEADVAAALDRHGGRMPLDEDMLTKAAAVARHLVTRDSPASVSVPVSPASLGSAAFLAGAERLLGGERGVGKRLVFTLRQSDLRRLGAPETAGVSRLARLGAALKLDGVGGLDADWAELVRRGFDFAAVDCGLILEARSTGETGRLVQAARSAGLQLIASAVDSDRLVPDLLDYDVPLAEGPALGAVRPVRAEILAGLAPSPDAPAAEPEGGAGFRDYLRRVG